MLNFLAYFQNVPLNRHVARINYGAKGLGHLAYETIGGNVAEVDGQPQTGLRPLQVALLEGEFPTVKYTASRAGAMYPGVKLSRVIAIIGDAYVVIDRLTSDRPRRYSLVFYPGSRKISLAGVGGFKPYPAFAGEGKGYADVQSPARAAGVNAFTLQYDSRLGKKLVMPTRARIMMDGEGEVIRGEAWSGWHPALTSVLFARRTAPSAAFVLVLEAGEKALPVEEAEVLPVTVDGKAVSRHQGLAVLLNTAASSYLILDCDLPGKKRAAGIETTDSLWVGRIE